ncbi:MAG TPA: hypothetical protein VIO80_12620 [Candidatus Dormibacteraeota bacterium]|jgi:hypothetical protein
MQGAKPQLIQFQAGYPGPPGIEYRGGRVTLVAAIVYADGVVIEWVVGPVPDLSWMPPDSSEGSSSFFPQFHDQPESIERMRRFKRLSTFWGSAKLTDDVGTQYQWASGDAGGGEEVGYRGDEVFTPSPPASATELTVRAHDLQITIAMSSRRTEGTKR